MKEAFLYEQKGDQTVRCDLCSHRCSIQPGKRGICNVRKNQNGILRTLVYGEVIAANSDPIEKKPLYHFLPGSRSYSVATPGCNFKCSFCQNWQISQIEDNGVLLGGRPMSPGAIAEDAHASGCSSIAYTYTEPTIFFEYAYDTARCAKELGLANLFVTNGYMTREALDMINPYLDACNVDLKAFTESFYNSFCKARLEPVLDSIRYMKELGLWIEITTLLIPDKNDSDEELDAIA